MSRNFPLAGLLRVRAMAEDTAAAELASARREERVARDRATRTAEMLGSSRPPGEADIAAWQAAIAARVALSSLLSEDLAAVDRAEQQVGRRQSEWTAARVRTRAVDRLRERHEEGERVQQEHAEQVALDEVAARSAAPTTPGEDA